jgi:hypothetical protein
VEDRKRKKKDSVGRRAAVGKMKHQQGWDAEEDQSAQRVVWREIIEKICPPPRRLRRRNGGRRTATHQT